MEEYLYTVEEMAKILKVNTSTVYKLIKMGYLTTLKLGRYKITKFELLRFLKKYNGMDLTDLADVKEVTFQ
ncbi:MAG: helix-turn-helix domain-containing protein [Clostridium tyrobutyricum]|jgi:excisionase family DNA binding protein|uniref:helix-turn-helix domain-containing protein n=1 Tax=Clostridium tyrobutyricum TaxID=1519 RepID=UPI000300D95F|nr:helix-turn-helix domain-containing protein [Clostridium tyrobutyricum]MBR9648699.1 helix-turn-helix domain-containing protein [Clostridium tyrobutyricum]MBV4415116.1 helix-turn-helix domain-containing protein [Clostridium tyrobutyricum]MBV4423452.1 helix-turn-helix domain-containing protein [Clostridium tyrobutyricum]MBV4430715.1 helix-turn-helix domain-containing protein [Clostridium tyrobutyricum]MBV4448038.1 helix-turn-helix domain-containing protein [Clostridium tyrobutyricum]